MSNGIEKSLSDKRQYKQVVLKNQLQVLLVNDETAEKAAAAMDVQVGHFSDPADIPGLAHFLEHMLFLGTTKYPDENSYSIYLNENGGKSNAYTSMENTNYYFDVSHSGLSGALDRFAQFFICPLFSAGATGRELAAVDSEHSKNIQDDSWRAFQLEKSTSSQSHPYSKFATGDSRTLRDIPLQNGIDVRQRLLEFHKTYYSSNQMKLVIVGRQSVDQLELMAREYFSEIPNYRIDSPSYGFGSDLPLTELGRHIQYIPVKELRIVELTWPTPCMLAQYWKGPDRYISNLLGHEGPGSVLALLKELGWANELSAGLTLDNSTFGFFKVHVDCTAVGITKVYEICAVIFQYIQLLSLNDYAGINQVLFDEVATQSSNSFRFQSSRDPFYEVSSIAINMQKYPVQHVLSHSLLREFDRQAIVDFLELLKPSNLQLMTTSKIAEHRVLQEEKWYGTRYVCNSIPSIDTWNSPLPNPKLHLPTPNEFLPTKFDILKFSSPKSMCCTCDKVVVLGGRKQDTYRQRLASSNHRLNTEEWGDLDTWRPPCIIASSASVGGTLWFKQDTTFKLPKVSLTILVNLPVSQESPKNSVVNYLFVAMAESVLTKVAYAAGVAGLLYSIDSNSTGISISLGGFSEKLPLLLDHISRVLAHPEEFSQHEFQRLKEKCIGNYKNFEKEQPYQQVLYNVSLLLKTSLWHVAEKLEAVESITLEDITSLNLFSNAYLESLVTGNITAENAIALVSTLSTTLGITSNYTEVFPRRIVQMTGDEYFYAAGDPGNSNSAIEVVYQVGPDTAKTMALLKLLVQVAQEPCFNILRTEQQLGYIVSCGIRLDEGICALRILVQSSVADPFILSDRIDSFVESLRDIVLKLSTSALNQHVDALLGTLMKPDNSLLEEARRWIVEINSRFYNFSRMHQVASEIVAISHLDLVSFFEKHVGGPSRRKLVVGLFGSSHVAALEYGNDSSAARINKFRASHPLYPVQYLQYSNKL